MRDIKDPTEIAKILKERGIEIHVGGCGCCGSPWVTVIVDGVTLVDEEEDYKIHPFHY